MAEVFGVIAGAIGIADTVVSTIEGLFHKYETWKEKEFAMSQMSQFAGYLLHELQTTKRVLRNDQFADAVQKLGFLNGLDRVLLGCNEELRVANGLLSKLQLRRDEGDVKKLTKSFKKYFKYSANKEHLDLLYKHHDVLRFRRLDIERIVAANSVAIVAEMQRKEREAAQRRARHQAEIDARKKVYYSQRDTKAEEDSSSDTSVDSHDRTDSDDTRRARYRRKRAAQLVPKDWGRR